MKFTQLLLCAITILLPLSVGAAPKKSHDRWFEVEIILFSQLGDKAALIENFPEHTELPVYRHTTDLLAQYINPDITTLKQLIPSCDLPENKVNNWSRQYLNVSNIFTIKSLKEILVPQPALISQPLILDIASDITNKSIEISNAALFSIKLDELMLDIDKNNSSHQNKLLSKYSQNMMCRINETYFADIKANDPSFNYNGFTIDKMPLIINGTENTNNNTTHLLSKSSLKLGDIVKDLKYTKNFRPILHMGWRQVARAKKHAVPVKVYGGDNYKAAYQKRLANYQKELQNNNQLTQPQNIANINIADANDTNSQVIIAEQNFQAHIANIVQQISTVPENTEALLNEINTDNARLNNAYNTAISEQNLLSPALPKAPVQEWFINGLFNIHLKHYLFITADFTVLDKTLSELASDNLANDALTHTGKNMVAGADSTLSMPSTLQGSAPIASNKNTQAKAIRFKQNRRVISGEVHYFDHPYMGMIVQIRPYKKTNTQH